MGTSEIRKRLTDYLQFAEDKMVKAIYTMVEDEINTAANDWDGDFIEELNRRSKSFTNGTAKTYSWEETKQLVINRVKERKK